MLNYGIFGDEQIVGWVNGLSDVRNLPVQIFDFSALYKFF